MNYEEIKNKFKNELDFVDSLLINNLDSNCELISDVGKYITLYSGKKIRPLITLLFGKLINFSQKELFLMSAVVELIHTATLLHDDVVDNSNKRRSKLSINKIWGNKESILIGDFLYTKSFQMMVAVNNFKILELMAETTNIMSEGEIKQLLHRKNYNMTENDYLNIIISKTAKLFEFSSSIASILCNSNDFIFKASRNFGIFFGIAYQLIDDMLDYTVNDDIFGKKTGNDILNGTFTLPLIRLMNTDIKKKKKIFDLLSSKNFNDYNLIKKIVIESNVLDYTFNLAKNYITLARKNLNIYENTEHKNIAFNILNFIIDRKF